MVRKLALDNTTLNSFQEGDIAINAARNLDAEYYVPVTQRREFVFTFDKLGFDKQYNICNVLVQLNPELIELVSSPFGIGQFGSGPFGGEESESPHYEEIMKKMGEDENHAWDALGAEAAIENDMEFVTEDGGVIDALTEYAPEHLLRYDEFKMLIEAGES